MNEAGQMDELVRSERQQNCQTHFALDVKIAYKRYHLIAILVGFFCYLSLGIFKK